MEDNGSRLCTSGVPQHHTLQRLQFSPTGVLCPENANSAVCRWECAAHLKLRGLSGAVSSTQTQIGKRISADEQPQIRPPNPPLLNRSDLGSRVAPTQRSAQTERVENLEPFSFYACLGRKKFYSRGASRASKAED